MLWWTASGAKLAPPNLDGVLGCFARKRAEAVLCLGPQSSPWGSEGIQAGSFSYRLPSLQTEVLGPRFLSPELPTMLRRGTGFTLPSSAPGMLLSCVALGK